MSNLRPRRCVLGKGSNGYGFHLHGEKGKTGQFIRLVEPDSPAATAGLFAGDRLTFVNGDTVEGESHQQVVARIRATVGSLELIVVDAETAELLKKHNLECRKEYVTEGIPLPGSESAHGDSAESKGTSREATATSAENGNLSPPRLNVSAKDWKADLRPRLCSMKKGAKGYGFNLHSEKSKPGQYIRAVDEDSPAAKAGLKPQDKIVQVNSMSVVGMQHSEVVAAIKAGGDETSLLVVDREAEAFFNSCKVIPTEANLTGPLPEPVSNGGAEEELDGKVAVEVKPNVSVSLSTSSTSSTASLPTSAGSTPPPEVQVAPAKVPDASLALSMSLAQAKERAHQKRSSKKAPAMDWSKRNELFSNL
ncbi:Na(+)/H(+) exchange regulatory cofactor NHE-RF1 isoform X1 [Coregonus clupeaformis]|uniref:Na(+)/H(+) exchange regulatory cofactor NHE-RF1 isoform X1 n=1 Tax=Coregonus clupeaformis TaxID=59861 RepID=UPI001BE0B9A9|nr:Na(+)/H(+) exchange regulatory cofactor NHE-RF1 isoform X1 [Coregonus clupeaformis]